MSAASLAAAPARRLNRRALRTLGGVLIAAGALAANVWFWGREQLADPVLVVARDLPAGHRLTADDLGRREMRLAPETRALAVPAARLADVLDRPLAQQLRPGTLLTADRLAAEPAAEGRAIIAVGLKPELTPPLAPGSRVDVVALGAVPVAAGAATAGGQGTDRAVLARGAIVRSVSFPALGLAGAGLGGAGGAAGRADRAPSGAVLLVEPAAEGPILAAAAGAGVALALAPPGADADSGAGVAPAPAPRPTPAPAPAPTGGRP